MSHVGLWRIECRVTILNLFTYENAVFPTNSIDFEVRPPDSVELVNENPVVVGVDVPILPGNAMMPDFSVKFLVKGNGRVLNVNNIQEEVIHSKYGYPAELDFAMNIAPFMSISNGVVTDLKGVAMNEAARDLLTPGVSRIDEFDQTFGVVLPTTDGTSRLFRISPTFHFMMQAGSDRDHWKLILVE